MKIELKKIDKSKILLGEIELLWNCDDPKINKFEIFRSKNSNINLSTDTPLTIIENSSKNEAEEYVFIDTSFPTDSNLYYLISASIDGIKFSSNIELAKVKILNSLNLDDEYIKNAAYYESLQNTPCDKKIWRVAEIDLILHNHFPIDFKALKTELRSLKKTFPNFQGKIEYPKHEQIKEKAKALYMSGINLNDLDWLYIERELILKKILALIEYEFE